MPRLNILHVFRAPVGGLFRHVLDLTHEQIARGHRVGIVADSRTGGAQADEILRALAPSLALGLTRVPMRRHANPGDFYVLGHVMRRVMRSKADVVHGPDLVFMGELRPVKGVDVLWARSTSTTCFICGTKTPGLSWAEGESIVARADAAPTRPETMEDNHSAYGCNMAFRRAAIGELGFDERLVLYGWQEDTDLAARVAARGRMVRSDRLWGVHLGIKRGRSPGRQFGYSQMVNPRYLVAKGTMRAASALRLAGRNFLANMAHALFPEPYIDRVGRLKGNLLGLWDIVTGRWRPERAAEL